MNLFYFTGGDLEFFWKEQIASFSWLPQLFHGDQGFGYSSLLSLWLTYPFQVIIKLLSLIGFSWFFIEKLLWFSVFVLALYCSHKLANNWITPIIYSANTYFLLLFSGSQLGVAWAYALSPLVLYRSMKFQKANLREQIINGLCLGLLITFDLRIASLVLAAIFLYGIRRVVPFLVATSVHLFWILPTLLASRGAADLGAQFTGSGMLSFLSFADFSHALAFLHPNWPENLFGKVYFLKPEFLVIPVLAFLSLLFTKKNSRMWYFALLSLIGVFFAKGVNPPFGGVYSWMFTHIPGFVMFRDPTKFYLYVAIGYSVLLPTVLRKFNKKIIYVLFILFWLFTLRGFQVKTTQLPQGYIRLKNLLVSDPIPSRTLWIPAKENFAYYSDVHPILTATTAATIDPSVRYVIVPIDLNKRIFLNDYKFDPKIRQKVISDLTGRQLIRDPGFTDVSVFENPNFSGMHVQIPAVIAQQQKLANVGLGLSAGFLLCWLLLLFFIH